MSGVDNEQVPCFRLGPYAHFPQMARGWPTLDRCGRLRRRSLVRFGPFVSGGDCLWTGGGDEAEGGSRGFLHHHEKAIEISSVREQYLRAT